MDKEKVKKELDFLVDEGADIYFATTLIYDKGAFSHHDEKMENMAKECAKKIKFPHGEYYIWYDKTCNALRVLDSKKFEDFQNFYTNYTEEWIIDRTKDSFFKFEKGFRMQRYILASINKSFDNDIFNLERDIHHEVYKSEIDIAKDIQEQGHLKIAGAVAGVIIEAHLKTVVAKRNITLKSKRSLSTYNDALKKEGAYPDSRWRQIQTCGDIRNNCIHSKDIDPDEIDTIILSAEQIIKKVS